MIRVQNLSVRYGKTLAVDDVSLTIPRGSFTLLTGASGCGKSTLARALTGLIPHALPARMAGSVIVAGLETQAHTLPELAQQITLVFQNPASQLFHLSVREEVAFGPRNLGLPEREVGERVAWAVQAVGISELQEQSPAELSGGQQQLVAVAAALAMRPQILVLDEPTASLDVAHSRRVLKTLHRLHGDHGMTVLLIEHRFARAIHYVDRVLVMDGGRIIADGPPDAILARSELQERLGLRRLADHPPSPWPELIRPDGHPSSQAVPVLALENVSAGYRRQPVIHDISLQINAGEFVALVGENGAGKSTLGRVAAGLLKPLHGQVRSASGKRPAPGLDVSMLFQNPLDQLFTDQVGDEIAFGPKNFGREDARSVDEALDKADLAALRTRHPLALSVGQQQRTTLAACAVLRPRLLILDEPTLGQDWGHLQQLMDYLARLNAEGTAILLISHDYKLVHHYARRVVLMQAGRIAKAGRLIDKRPGTPEVTQPLPKRNL
jgi:energy-coupling factor transport system ATP-binding protein